MSADSRFSSQLLSSSLDSIILENISDAVIIVDNNMIIKTWNSAAEKLYGYSRQEAIGRAIMELLTPDLPQSELSRRIHDLKMHRNSIFESVHQTKDNRLVYIEANTVSLSEIGFLTVNRDITHRKQYEEKILKEKQRLELLAEFASIFANIIDDYLPALNITVKKLTDHFCDFCVIRLLEEDGNNLNTTAFYHSLPEAYEFLKEMYSNNTYGINEGFTGNVMKKGIPLLIPVVTNTEKMKPAHISYYKKFGLSSVLHVPITVEGKIIGSLGMYRDKPGNPFGEEDQLFLQNVAGKIGGAVTKAQLLKEKTTHINLLQDIINSVPLGLVIIDNKGNRYFSNQVYEEIWQGNEYNSMEDHEKYIGWKPNGDRLKPEDWGSWKALNGQPSLNEEILIQCFDGSKKNVLNSAVPVLNNGVLESVIVMLVDITDMKKSEEKLRALVKEKEILIKELFHRTKNNMQVITSLLRLKRHSIENKEAGLILDEMANRILTISLVHQKLYQSNNLSSIDLKDYINDLLDILNQSYSTSANIDIKVYLESVKVLIDTAIPCGLIINELISNAMKYAFPDGREGEISISLKAGKDGFIELQVSDNGIGIPDVKSVLDGDTLGTMIIKSITEDQLQGHFNLTGNNGVTCTIVFKDDLYLQRI